jgi:hypothetical protein
MIDLDAWLKANNPAVNWTLTIAYGINDNGQVTGWGIDNDPVNPVRERAFLLDASSLLVPEPAGFVLLGIGTALTVAIRRRLQRQTCSIDAPSSPPLNRKSV